MEDELSEARKLLEIKPENMGLRGLVAGEGE